MIKISSLLMLIFGLLAGFNLVNASGQNLLNGVEHFKQSTIKIQGANTVIYCDPFRVTGEPHDGDLVLITHTHRDHFSIPDLKKVMKPGAILVIPMDGVEQAKAEGLTRIIPVIPNESYQEAGIKFQTVPAYNTNKNYHPRANNWVGYLVAFNKQRYYLAGDTDLIPEMEKIKTDVAFLPVGGTFTMTASEAAQAANLIKPKIAVAIHFGDVVGSIEDAKQFTALLGKGIQGMILKK